jgi:hypothetical protein
VVLWNETEGTRVVLSFSCSNALSSVRRVSCLTGPLLPKCAIIGAFLRVWGAGQALGTNCNPGLNLSAVTVDLTLYRKLTCLLRGMGLAYRPEGELAPYLVDRVIEGTK